MDKPNDTSNAQGSASYWKGISERTGEILNIRAEATKDQTWQAAVIDKVGHFMAQPYFFFLLLITHLLWIVLNLPVYPWFEPWDPYPFMFLATVASAEAPFIALLVLMHQERNNRIDELREETNLQVSLHIEREVTMVVRLIREIHDKLDIQTRQREDLLEHIEQDLEPQRLMEKLQETLEEMEGADSMAP